MDVQRINNIKSIMQSDISIQYTYEDVSEVMLTGFGEVGP